LNTRRLEKKGSMENLSHMQLNKAKSVVKIEEYDSKGAFKSNNNKIKDVSMNSNNTKEIVEEIGSKTYRKPTKELTRDVSKTNLKTNLTKHNRNNSFDIAKNEKEKKTINSLKEANSTNNFNPNPNQQLPYFNNINIFAANMNNFKNKRAKPQTIRYK